MKLNPVVDDDDVRHLHWLAAASRNSKVGRLHVIEVLHVNALANALKPAVLSGELLDVKVVREGKEYEHGVGYLDDGTMVVVDGAGKPVGMSVAAEMTSVLQSPSGQMIFCRLTGSDS